MEKSRNLDFKLSPLDDPINTRTGAPYPSPPQGRSLSSLEMMVRSDLRTIIRSTRKELRGERRESANSIVNQCPCMSTTGTNIWLNALTQKRQTKDQEY